MREQDQQNSRTQLSKLISECSNREESKLKKKKESSPHLNINYNSIVLLLIKHTHTHLCAHNLTRVFQVPFIPNPIRLSPSRLLGNDSSWTGSKCMLVWKCKSEVRRNRERWKKVGLRGKNRSFSFSRWISIVPLLAD